MTTQDQTNQMIADAIATHAKEASDAAIDRLRLAWLECERLQQQAEVYRYLANFRQRLRTDKALQKRVANRWRAPTC